jgi:hypothetical protein
MSISFSNVVSSPGSSTLTSKGYILSHDGTNPTQVPVGSNGQTFRPNTSASSGLGWGAALSSSVADFEPIAYSAITANTASVQFSSIPGTYFSLLLVCFSRASNTGIQYRVQINGNTSTSAHGWIQERGGAGSLDRYSTKNTNSWDIASGANSSSPSDSFGLWSMQIDNYTNSSKYKSALMRATVTGSSTQETSFANAIFRSNDSITSINIIQYGASFEFVSGTKFALYGIK